MDWWPSPLAECTATPASQAGHRGSEHTIGEQAQQQSANAARLLKRLDSLGLVGSGAPEAATGGSGTDAVNDNENADEEIKSEADTSGDAEPVVHCGERKHGRGALPRPANEHERLARR